MSLRPVAILVLALLVAVPAPVLAGGSGTVSKTVPVSEVLPWFDQAGLSFSYSLTGTSVGIQGGQQTYLGTASVETLGMASNDTLRISTNADVGNPLFPNGTFYDDPFFPGYVQVLPLALVVPSTFTVLSPSYGLTFHYLGNVTSSFEGGTVETYAYTVSASGPAQGESAVVKYYRVIPSSGLIVEEELTNTQVGTTLNATLTGLGGGSTARSGGTLQFTAPVFAAPGSSIVYKNTGAGNQVINYTTIFSEPGGLFAYSRTVVANGTLSGTQFFVDDAAGPRFYPAASSFGSVITFPVAVGSLETGILTRLGTTTVKTLDGYFLTQAYANKTIGFEAYLDNSTGVAVFLELPGGVLQLYASNYLFPEPPPGPSLLLDYLVPVAILVVAGLLVAMHFRRAPRRRGRR
ncbi:MAG: hypothetical protein JRN21_02190 [Nitrososphaerota archaeon]|nr:hypothetical protein [Nitrososphaerota archaeon]